jgi:predicted O-methyltransferase YrrM
MTWLKNAKIVEQLQLHLHLWIGETVTDYPNWFQGAAKDNFEQYLEHFKEQDNLNFLQVGVFTGDASKWLVDNILTGTGCMLTDVDTWEGSDEDAHHQMDFSNVELTYDAKVAGYKNITKEKMDSAKFFSKVQGLFDFIYVDADHTAEGVYIDAMNSWQFLKPNGILAFDDYTWGDGLPDQSLAPRPGIDKFLDKYNGNYHLIYKGAQVWIRKNA